MTTHKVQLTKTEEKMLLSLVGVANKNGSGSVDLGHFVAIQVDNFEELPPEARRVMRVNMAVKLRCFSGKMAALGGKFARTSPLGRGNTAIYWFKLPPKQNMPVAD